MIAYIGDVQHLPLLVYSQLSETAKEVARETVLSEERKGLGRCTQAAREEAKRNINGVVNDRWHITRLHKQLERYRRLITSTERLERMIESNLCNFLEDGTYVVYMKPI